MPHAEPAAPGRGGWPHGRRRTAFVVLALGVVAAHWWLALLLPQVRIGEGSADRMPRRIEVAYVRELKQAAPPAAPPVVVRAKKPARAKGVAPPVAAASAPEAAASTAEPDDARQAGSGTADEPAPQAAAAAASAVDEAASAPPVAAAESAASAPAAFEWPPSTRLTYSLSGNYRGEVTGGAMVEWVRAGLRYQVHLDVWVGAQAAPLVGRRMTSDGDLTDQGLVPRRYDEETRALFREVRRRTIRFEPDRVVLPNGSERERPPALQDAASQFVQLTWLFTTRPDLLQPGRSVEVALALPTNVSHWAYDVLDKATVQTPIGPVEAYHMKPRRQARPGGDLVAEVWFAPTLMYLPVRLLIRQDEMTYIDMVIDRAPLQEAAASAPK